MLARSPRLCSHSVRLCRTPCVVAASDSPAAPTDQPFARRTGALLHRWQVLPVGREGYAKAAVTAGVDTDELSAKTMESRKVPGLYFVGEVVDVAGHLGGFISNAPGRQVTVRDKLCEAACERLPSQSGGSAAAGNT